MVIDSHLDMNIITKILSVFEKLTTCTTVSFTTASTRPHALFPGIELPSMIMLLESVRVSR